MSVERMCAVSIIGSMADLDKTVNTCGETGVFQPEPVSSFYSELSNFSLISSDNPYLKPIKMYEEIAKDSGKKLMVIDIGNFKVSQSKLEDFSLFVYNSIFEFVEKKKRLYIELENIPAKIQKLKCFYGLNENIDDVLSCKFVRAEFGKMPLSSYQKFLNYSGEVELIFIPLTSNEESQWGIYFVDLENAEEADRLISSFYFEKIEIEPYHGTPYDCVVALEKQSLAIYKKLEATDKKISKFWESHKSKCIKFYSKLVQLSMYHEIKNYAMQYSESFILTGWVPESEQKSFSEKINDIRSVECECRAGEKFERASPPVRLKNNRFVRPFEFFVNTYGLPSYGEFDPTTFVAITYMILFGIMFADVGQGLLVSLAGYIMWKIKKMKLGLVLIPCGISSMVFGFVFGSVFGYEHVLDPVYKALFGLHEKPIEVMNRGTIMYMIGATVGIGIFMLIFASILGIVSEIKKGYLWHAVFGHKGIFNLIFYLSIIFFMLDSIIFKTGVANTLFAVIFIVLPLILMMFGEVLIKIFEKKKDWKPESWGEYITRSFFEVFEVILSLISNTMSFLRVGSFVLVHAGLMSMFFTIAELTGAVGGVIIIILGNLFVTGMEAFFTAIQVMRLEFYEMFSKFFEGQGKEFTPIKVNFSENA